ncbi:MAG: hypothetical protein ABFC77_12340 [Thermoguttaceae bacterium]
MAKRPWLEAIGRRLLAGGLPPAYIRRLTNELADHFDDLTEDVMSKDAEVVSRLGEADQVADAAIAAYERRTFFGRHPSAKFLVFGVSPMVAMFLVFVSACLGIVAVGAIFERCGVCLSGKGCLGGVDPAFLGWGFSVITTIVPAALLTFFYCRIAGQSAIGKKWMSASCIMVAFVAMLPFHRILLSEVPGKSIWTIGLGVPPSLLQCVQLSIPLAVGLWFVCRGGKRSLPEERLPTAA